MAAALPYGPPGPPPLAGAQVADRHPRGLRIGRDRLEDGRDEGCAARMGRYGGAHPRGLPRAPRHPGPGRRAASPAAGLAHAVPGRSSSCQPSDERAIPPPPVRAALAEAALPRPSSVRPDADRASDPRAPVVARLPLLPAPSGAPGLEMGWGSAPDGAPRPFREDIRVARPARSRPVFRWFEEATPPPGVLPTDLETAIDLGGLELLGRDSVPGAVLGLDPVVPDHGERRRLEPAGFRRAETGGGLRPGTLLLPGDYDGLRLADDRRASAEGEGQE